MESQDHPSKNAYHASKILNKDLKNGFSKIKVSKKKQNLVLKKFCKELMIHTLKGKEIKFPTPDITIGVYRRERTKNDPFPRNRKTGKVVMTASRINSIYEIVFRINRTNDSLYVFKPSNTYKKALNTLLKSTNIEYQYNPWLLTNL